MRFTRDSIQREFHISRRARDRYQFDLSLFTLHGNVIIANFYAARVFAQKMNLQRDLVRFPEQAVRAGDVNAMGLIDEILHYVVGIYRRERLPDVAERALTWLEGRLGRATVDAALRRFADEFPPLALYRGEIGLDDYVDGETDGTPHRQVVLEELLLLWLANVNPAFLPFRELFDDTGLAQHTAYGQIVAGLHEFFESQPRFGPYDQNLVDMLRSPALASPNSLEGQLRYIREHWGYLLGPYLQRLLSSLDLIEEERRQFGLGPGPSLVYEFGELGDEPERFSPDRDWMPCVVLIAKHTYVWLHQLSREFGRSITRLDQIPDEALDTLARRGFNGLWLIGLWERSPASQRIKQLCGNPEAVASAYSIFDYQIAGDLGGEDAYQNLRDRAWQRGIRLASDMVPNHMGIDSPWVMHHPDWFIGLDYSPYPSYTFNGPDLSWDSRVGIFIEDHYYDRTDAAVVFKRVDRWTGHERYIYHGNDGTSMPWNDTAQLNYLHPEVREAVIQTILHVARRFPIIRFDAAMTLAKRHYQRLWYPEPGSGGGIPSRSDHGLTRAQFNEAMPVEFWREVVDRIAVEAPDTLLLAEAFWLMEGYFVRTLGMHRVYNSAFMNMLRDEDNAKYRAVIKNTLEFDPEIMKRYVNFMNNPDERTAVDQFGKGDKYFGICTMMATLPGLPMFGHGQVEGYGEKYGMEYRRAYWDEWPDEELVRRHEREIFPLLHRRWLFAGVENFQIYDLFDPNGTVNEDVFAYSNRVGDARALVLFHNRYAEAQGWIRTSAARAVKRDGDRVLVQTTIGEGLGLHADPNRYCIFRDHVTGLEYLRNSQELCEQGLRVKLHAYQCQVFVDFREVWDTPERHYAQLAEQLAGRGVPSVDAAVRELQLRPVLHPFRELVNPGMFGWLLDNRVSRPDQPVAESVLDEVEWKALQLLRGVKELTGATGDEAPIARELRRDFAILLELPAIVGRRRGATRSNGTMIASLRDRLAKDTEVWGTLFAWGAVYALGKVVDTVGYELTSRSWIDEWMLDRVIAETLRGIGLSDESAWRALETAKLLTAYQAQIEAPSFEDAEWRRLVESWLHDPDAHRYLRVNRYEGILWFNKEAFERLLWWTALARLVRRQVLGTSSEDAVRETVNSWPTVTRLQQAAETAGYQVESLLTAIGRRSRRGVRRTARVRNA